MDPRLVTACGQFSPFTKLSSHVEALRVKREYFNNSLQFIAPKDSVDVELIDAGDEQGSRQQGPPAPEMSSVNREVSNLKAQYEKMQAAAASQIRSLIDMRVLNKIEVWMGEETNYIELRDSFEAAMGLLGIDEFLLQAADQPTALPLSDFETDCTLKAKVVTLCLK